MQPLQTFGPLAMLLCSMAGFSLMLLGWLQRKFSKARTIRLIPLGFFLVGTGIFCGAVANIEAIHTSTIITAEGSITALREQHSRGDAYYFHLQSDPPTPELTAYISGLHLKNGDLVRASYLSNTGEITSMTILTGQDALSTVQGGTGSTSTYLFLGLAGVFIVFGVALRRHMPSPHR